MADSFQKKFPELLFGLVAPIGAEVGSTLAAFRSYFQQRDYRVVEIKITDIFRVFERYISPEESRGLVHRGAARDRYETYIAYGNQLRAQYGDDILAATAVRRLMRARLRLQRREPRSVPFERTVFLLHQFKRKEEIDLLRAVYGRLFFQVSIYSRRGARVDYLSRKFASSDNKAGPHQYRDVAEALIQRDENEKEKEHGQRVAQAFHDADFIISLDARESVKEQANRFCELIFGSNRHSPNRREYGLFLAKAAALRSLDLSRQVGAAVFSPTGEIVSLGSNEVPKGNGGTYWCDDDYDDRDFQRKRDSNFDRKREMLGELAGLISPAAKVEDLLKDPRIKDSQFMDALEYGRIVHAEMSAISDAARWGRQVKDGILYCTTFPCHMCAKHIVAAGISKVVFLEPYPKSLAADLHSDSVIVEGSDRGRYQHFPAVEFEHFYGVSPRRYREIFERGKRKDDDGGFVEYTHGRPQPIMDLKFPFYAELEARLTDDTTQELLPLLRDADSAQPGKQPGKPKPNRARPQRGPRR